MARASAIKSSITPSALRLLRLWLRQHQDLDSAGAISTTIEPFGGCLEVLRPGARNVDEGLRVPLNEREQRALHLEHNAMPSAEGVVKIGHVEVQFSNFV